jgi:hypothetical protein
VDTTTLGFSRIFRVHHLLDLGGVSGKQLLVRGQWRELSLPVLFAGNFWNVAARMVWQTNLVADVADFFAGLFCLVGAGRFRFTCYYYRGAYYKGFWADPIACAVGEPRKKYLGEKYFPLILQNVHRYFAYLAVLFIIFLTHDAWKGLWFDDANGVKHFGLGVGSIVLILNVIFLACYTFGCHSVRHMVGGFLDTKTKAPSCAKAYNCVTCLNKRHMMWAWISLFGVGLTDLYVRLCAMGKIHDFIFFKF